MKTESSDRGKKPRRNLIRKRTKAGVLLLCLVLLITGCAGGWFDQGKTSPYESSYREDGKGPFLKKSKKDYSGSSSKEDSDKEKSDSGPQQIKEAVRELTCVHPTAYCNVIPAENGRILIAWNDYEASRLSLRVVDVERDCVVRQRDLPGNFDLIAQVFSDGVFALRDWSRGRYLFLDQDLKEVGDFSCSETGGFLNADHSYFYFVKDRVLCRMSTETEETFPVELETNLRFSYINQIDPYGRFLQLSVYLTPFGTECGSAVIDIETGTVVMLKRELNNMALVETERAIFVEWAPDIGGYRVSYGEGTDCYSIGAEVFQKTRNLTITPNSNLLVGLAENSDLYRLGSGGSVEVAHLASRQIYGELEPKCFLQDSEYLVGSLYTDRKFRIMVIATKEIQFEKLPDAIKIDSIMTVDTSVFEAYKNSLGEGKLPENMLQVRQTADLLEETYGVTILLSDQCSELLGYSGYEIYTTDRADLYDEAGSVGYFLGVLDTALSLYPEGYFRQFRNSFGEGGIYFLPVGEIVSDIGAIGLCFETTGFQGIAIDVRQNELVGTICHEIWHASENKMWESFDRDGWTQMNPEGFVYDDDRAFYEEIGDPLPIPEDPRMTDPSGFTYFASDNSEVYFADDYARTLAREDRARIMEYFMAPNLEWVADALIDYEPIYQKLLYLSRALRKGFDTEGWDNVRWERFFTPEEINDSDAAFDDQKNVLVFTRTFFLSLCLQGRFYPCVYKDVFNCTKKRTEGRV